MLPAPACDLIDRFTNAFGVPFTLRDLHGTVVASTAGDRAGESEIHRSALELDGVIDIRDRTGPLSVAPVFLASGRAGYLVAYGEPGQVSQLVAVAAISMGMALDFAEAAARLGGNEFNRGWLLHQLLRGSRVEAARARPMAATVGWNLFEQRVCVVIDLRHCAELDPEVVKSRIRENLDDAASTPYGQVDRAEWVILLRHERSVPWRTLADRVSRIHSTLGCAGEVVTGIGELHPPRRPVRAIRRSYREARHALEIGYQLHGPGVYNLRTLGAAAFFAPSRRSRRRLARTILGGTDRQDALLETLKTYLDADLSVTATAESLGVHRHTVRNHLDRIREVSGLDPRSLDGAVQLKLAILALATDPADSDSA